MDAHEPRKFPRLETLRLVLRQMTMDDLDFYFHHFSIKEIEEGTGFPAPRDLDAAREELQRFIISLFDKGQGFRWGITIKGEAELIGTCGFYEWNKEFRKAEIGYDLEPVHWGKGIMTEALTEMLRFGFEEMKLNRVQVTIAPSNLKSIRLMQRLGFKEEGVLRENFIFKGKLQDDVMFSLLRKDWDEYRAVAAGIT